MNLVPLSVISSYSLLQSTIKINSLVKDAKSKGYKSLALTDNNVLYGVMEFDECMRNNGLKPIYGITVLVNGLFLNNKKYPIIFLAKNNEGYKKLLRISTQLMSNSKSTLNDLKNLNDMFILFPPNGELSILLLNETANVINGYIDYFLNKCDTDSIYYGVSFNESITTNRIKDIINELNSDYKLPLVALDPIKFLNQDDYLSYKAINCIKSGNILTSQLIEETDCININDGSLLPMQDAIDLYKKRGFFDAVVNTNKISAQCNVTLNYKSKIELPSFPTFNNMLSSDYLKYIAQNGLKRKFNGDIPEKYYCRLNKELNTIIQMGFTNYFLIVWDVVKYARKNGIMIGPGRGSAAGSLVAYSLNITLVDPLKYNLIFERFLNSNRSTMPDIDIDISDNGREFILQYIKEKYGSNHVSQIITFGTMAAKMALHEVGRVLNLPSYEVNDLVNSMPNESKITLDDAYNNSLSFRLNVNKNEKNKLLFSIAKKLEGLPHHYSTHAAGLILSKDSLLNIIPLQKGNGDMYLSQFSKNYVEKLGLLKIDFLGLHNLNILSNILLQINKKTGNKINLLNIKLNDNKTLDLFQNGETNGIFQFESSGIQSVLKKLHPTCFQDIVATIALYRPGPLKNIDKFIFGKKHPNLINYPDKLLIPILSSTYGVLVYQEQVIQAASIIGKLSLQDSDSLRRAISKKDKKLILQLKRKFLIGAQKNKVNLSSAYKIFNYIESFSNYGFNHSHAVAYSILSYWLAYLKVHYPTEFFTVLLNSLIGNYEKIFFNISDMKNFNIKLLLPNINESVYYFSVKSDDKILIGFSMIKNIKYEFIKSIIQERESNGKFLSFTDFLSRINHKWLKKEFIEPLIYSGVFDTLNDNRASLISNLDNLLTTFLIIGNEKSLLSSSLKPKFNNVSQIDPILKLKKEKEFLGIYISNDLFKQYKLLNLYYPINKVNYAKVGKNYYFMLLINSIKEIKTKNGQLMAFLEGDDECSLVSLIIFPQTYQKFKFILFSDKMFLVNGKVEKRNNKKQIIVNKIQQADEILKKISHRILFLRVDQLEKNKFQKLFLTLKKYPGQIPIILIDKKNHKNKLLNSKYFVSLNNFLFLELKKILGKSNIVLKDY